MNIERALSIRQPFAWAVVANVKKTENRTWSTDYRGTIAIHASTSPTIVNAFRKDSGCEYFSGEHLPFGAIIGLAEIVNVALYGPDQEDDPFACGPYCWTMAHGRFLEKPIPLKGKLNLFKLDSTTVSQLKTAKTFELDFGADRLALQASHAMTGEADPFECYAQHCDDFMYAPDKQREVAVWANRMIERWPEYPEGFANKSLNLLQQGDFTAAYDFAKRSIDLDSSYAIAEYAASLACQSLDLKEKAYEHVARFVNLAPDDPNAYVIRGQVLAHFGDLDDAIEQCEKALVMNSETAVAYDTLIDLHCRQKDYDAAYSVLEEALLRWPDDEQFLKLKAEIQHG